MKTHTKGRHISFFSASSFVIASMIGTGVFTSMGYQLKDIHSIFPLMMLWVIGGIIALSGVLCYAELSTALPRSGGEYHLLSYSLHPSIGFAAGIVSATVGFTAPSVASAILLGKYLSRIFPFLDQLIVASVVIGGLHLIHMKNIRLGIRFQDSFTAMKICIILAFIIFGFFVEQSQPLTILPLDGDLKIILSSSFAANLVWVLYAYTGWNSVIYISDEIINPKLNISRAMLFSTFFVMVLYVLLNYVFLYTTPINVMEGKEDFAPMNARYGEFYMWDGANLKHGNKKNETGSTRVSFDFRVLPRSKYVESGKKSVTQGMPFEIGQYYEEL